MSFKAKIICDGAGCSNEYELKTQFPDDVEAEYLFDIPDGWFTTYDNEIENNYCPECSPKVKAESEES